MSLTKTKKKLTKCILAYEHLSQEIEKTGPVEAFNDEEWTKYLRALGHETARLIQSTKILESEALLTKLCEKQEKIKKNKEWKKRSKKKKHQLQKFTEKKHKLWVKTMDWQVTIAQPTKKPKDLEEKKAEAKIKELTKKLERLKLLRDLRRKKLESQGHFFAEDGDDFFNSVQKSHEQQQEENVTSIGKKLVVHEHDVWNEQEIDQEAYRFWCKSIQSLDALVQTRRQWDKYITEVEMDERDTTGKIPPGFVTPSPPANWIWATYLL